MDDATPDERKKFQLHRELTNPVLLQRATRQAMAVVRNIHKAEEIVQESIGIALTRINDGDFPRTAILVDWICGIVRNVARNHNRRDQRYQKLMAEYKQFISDCQLIANESSPKLHDVQAILEAIPSLGVSTRDQRIFIDCVLHGHSALEVAGRESMTAVAVYQVMSGVRKKIRKHFHGDADSEQ
ncbi:hypothetical protein GC163_23065 [bacterium]|nr:hypothetical protein [bacterium]